MTARRSATVLTFIAAIAAPAMAQNSSPTPPTEFKPVAIGGIQTKSRHIKTRQGPAVMVQFTKDTDSRRLVALAAKTKQKPATTTKSLHCDCRLQLPDGKLPQLVLIAFDADGGVWYQQTQFPADTSEFAALQMSLEAMIPTAFSDDESGSIEWQNIQKVWLGVIIDGPATGSFTLRKANLSTEPYAPTTPFRVTDPDDLKWRIQAQHERVKSKLTTPPQAPDGDTCMKLQFTFGGKGHRWCLPYHPVPHGRAAGYHAVQFQYTADLPEGIDGVLVELIEQDGSNYYAHPPPSPTSDWKTIQLPFDRFSLGSWSSDENGALDPAQITDIAIAVHGAPKNTDSSGIIRAANVEFVP